MPKIIEIGRDKANQTQILHVFGPKNFFGRLPQNFGSGL